MDTARSKHHMAVLVLTWIQSKLIQIIDINKRKKNLTSRMWRNQHHRRTGHNLRAAIYFLALGIPCGAMDPEE